MIPEQIPAVEDRKRRLDLSLAGGVAWTAGAKWATQIFSWASLLVVARVLSEADYGVGEMAGFFFALTNTLAEFGVGTAVLHMAELDDDALHQLHGFSLLLCSTIYVVSLALSPLIASFFHNPHLVTVIMVTNITFFITGFQAVPIGLLQRDMDYRRLSFSEASMYLVQSAVTVVGALLGWKYWALVAGVVAGKASQAAMLMWWKPVGFAFPRWKTIQAPLEFGRQAAVGSLAVTAYLHSDVIVVGRMLGESALGTYRMAMYLASAPAEKISTLIMRTAGPLFANVQSEPAMVRRYFLLLADTMATLVAPAMVGLIMVAPDAVSVVLGAKWAGAVRPLVWLSGYMIVTTLSSLVSQVLMSQRQTKFTMRISLFNLAIMPIAFILGSRWGGTTGVAAAWILASPLTALPSAVRLLRRIELKWQDVVNAFLPSVVGSVAMALALLGLRRLPNFYGQAPSFRLAVMVGGGAFVYGAVLMIFFREKVMRYVRFARGLRGGTGAE